MPNPVLSSLTLPVKDPITGEVTEETFDLPAGGGGSVTVDDELSSTSENPVQNKVIYSALENKSVKYIELTANVAQNATSASFTDAAITSTKTYEVYSTVFTQITGMSISGTTLTVTFKAASAAMTMKLRIS